MIAPMPNLPPPDEVRVPFVELLHDTARTAPLTALEYSVFLHELVHDLRALAVVVARSRGESWRTIAAALDASPATTQRRYHRLDPT